MTPWFAIPSSKPSTSLRKSWKLPGWRTNGLPRRFSRATRSGAWPAIWPGRPSRSIGTSTTNLEPEIPSSAAEYFIRGLGDVDPISDELHRAVRERGEQAGAIGPTALADEVRTIRHRLAERFATEPADRLVSVFQGLSMRLDDYLETRIVELVVHLDDLAASADLRPPRVPKQAETLVLRTLVEIATARHGASVMIRALARRERVAQWPTAF